MDSVQREYPSVAFLSSRSAVVSDGAGLMYIFSIRDSEVSDPIATYKLSTELLDSPFRIHKIHRETATSVVGILSSRYYPLNPSPKLPGKATQIEFDIRAVRIDLLSLQSDNELRQMDILWHRRGQEVPIEVAFVESLNSYLIIGGSPYPDPIVPAAPVYEPSQDEMAPIPRAGETLDMVVQMTGPSKPPPYSWTQTSDSVTVAFPLPSTIHKTQIKVNFSSHTLTLHIDIDWLETLPIPRYSAKSLWDSISTTSSFWTWDKEADHSYGLLTLHLEKTNEGTRWMQVFAAASTKPSFASAEEDIEVPETLDPSELWLIRESLEKYTAALNSGNDASGLGLGRGVPSLADGEMDEDVDASVGRTAYMTWVGADGRTPAWSEDNQPIPFQLLSTTIPGIFEPHPHLVVKNNLDGLVFALKPETPQWEHVSTYSALAFVLASKQDTRFTYHIPDKAVFAFESGVRDRGGNVYIYRDSSTKEKWAKQSVLKVDDGRGGSLLGVGAVQDSGGNPIIVCLTEGELVLIRTI